MASIEQPNFSNVLSWRDHLPREITQSEAPSDLRKHSSDRELRKRAREEASSQSFISARHTLRSIP